MTSNVKVYMPSEIYELLPCGWPGLAKTCKNTVSFFKYMVVNHYACHMLSIFNCMPQHYIHTMYCYKTFHYKPYTNYKYILFITSLPYRITPKHVITLTLKCPNMENETVCKFRSNIKDICILDTMRNVSRQRK
jgi:hypothetical protein